MGETLNTSTQRFPISSALSGTFLVHRKRVLEKYLADQGAVMPGLRAPTAAPDSKDLTGTLGGSTTH